MRNGTGVILASAVAAAALLAGCTTQDATTATAGEAGAAGCDPGAFSSALGTVLQQSLMTVDSINGFECADGWAVVQASISGEQVPSIDEQYLLVARDSTWLLRSPEGACGSVTGDGVRPLDAAVPEALWEMACADQ